MPGFVNLTVNWLLKENVLDQTTSKISSSQRWATLGHSILFVIGFSIVFIIGWGGAATALGQLFASYKYFIGKIGGLIVILFGLITLRVINIPLLNYDIRPHWIPGNQRGWIPSLLMGLFFAAGWTPCIGPTLGAILTLGMSQQATTQAMVLSSGYALGMGIPFLIIGVGMDRAIHFIARFKKYFRGIEIASGILLIAVGVLMLTNQMTLIAIWALQHGYFFDLPLGGAAVPTYFIAIAGGLLSFLSPCVLPLVPAYIGFLSGQAVREARSSEAG
jgi:cytochrome c-type biogenesis protein